MTSTIEGNPGAIRLSSIAPPEALAASGMPALEVLECATSRAAEACGLGAVTGCLQPGLDADVIAVNGDASRDVSLLARPVMVMQRGRMFDPAAT